MIAFNVSTHGAEVQSLRRDGREYLWQGDPGVCFAFTYWIEIH